MPTCSEGEESSTETEEAEEEEEYFLDFLASFFEDLLGLCLAACLSKFFCFVDAGFESSSDEDFSNLSLSLLDVGLELSRAGVDFEDFEDFLNSLGYKTCRKESLRMKQSQLQGHSCKRGGDTKLGQKVIEKQEEQWGYLETSRER